MTPEKVIEEVQEKLSEWIEMQEDPNAFVARVLAKKVIKLESDVFYLESLLKHVIDNHERFSSGKP